MIKPQLFGLLKIHKPDIPLHPIISSIGLATYYLTKELARILGPLKGQLESYIKNSAHLVGSKLCGLTGNGGQLCCKEPLHQGSNPRSPGCG